MKRIALAAGGFVVALAAWLELTWRFEVLMSLQQGRLFLSHPYREGAPMSDLDAALFIAGIGAGGVLLWFVGRAIRTARATRVAEREKLEALERETRETCERYF